MFKRVRGICGRSTGWYLHRRARQWRRSGCTSTSPLLSTRGCEVMERLRGWHAVVVSGMSTNAGLEASVCWYMAFDSLKFSLCRYLQKPHLRSPSIEMPRSALRALSIRIVSRHSTLLCAYEPSHTDCAESTRDVQFRKESSPMNSDSNESSKSTFQRMRKS